MRNWLPALAASVRQLDALLADRLAARDVIGPRATCARPMLMIKTSPKSFDSTGGDVRRLAASEPG